MWKYYNHAIIANVPPHQDIDISKHPIDWKSNKHALLARWTTNFDCVDYQDFWYIIKDTPFDLKEVKAKRRYEINKGLANFDVRPINSREYIEEIFNVQVAAYSAYPEEYRPKVNHEKFIKEISVLDNDNYLIFGAFFKESNELCGYNYVIKEEGYYNFSVQKTNPQFEKFGLNAVLVYSMLQHLNEELSKGIYICDGSRIVSHKTSFQDYLEKYFNFRKAYCKLNVKYRPIVAPVVKILYLFRNILKKLDNKSIIHKINGVLAMEEIIRKQKNKKLN